MDRVTFATAAGVLWLALAVHFAAGIVSISAGTLALAVTKGGRWHKGSGLVFTVAMVILGLTAVGIGAFERRPSQVAGGLLAAYLVSSALTTVKPLPGRGRGLDIALMIAAFACAGTMLQVSASEWMDRTIQVVGRPRVVPPLIAGSLMLLAALGDLRAWRAGGLRGPRRLARHIWRMGVGLFVATGSFFLGQMTFIPAPVRIVPLLLVLAVAPLVVVVYWIWRVRVRGRMGGLLPGEGQAR